MSIALFPSGEPLRVSLTQSYAQVIGSVNGALIGMVGDEGLYGVVVAEDGQIHAIPINDFTVDWRYDVEKDRWVDVNHRQTDQEL